MHYAFLFSAKESIYACSRFIECQVRRKVSSVQVLYASEVKGMLHNLCTELAGNSNMVWKVLLCHSLISPARKVFFAIR